MKEGMLTVYMSHLWLSALYTFEEITCMHLQPVRDRLNGPRRRRTTRVSSVPVLILSWQNRYKSQTQKK